MPWKMDHASVATQTWVTQSGHKRQRVRLRCDLTPDHEGGAPGLAFGVVPHDGPGVVGGRQLGRAPHYADVSAVTESLLRSTSQTLTGKEKRCSNVNNQSPLLLYFVHNEHFI